MQDIFKIYKKKFKTGCIINVKIEKFFKNLQLLKETIFCKIKFIKLNVDLLIIVNQLEIVN